MKIKKPREKNFSSSFTNLVVVITFLIFSSNSTANKNNKSLPNGSIIAAKTGIMQFIIVPLEHQKDKVFHIKTIKMLCSEKKTCFLNFFTNSKNVKLSFPLDDNIMNEPTLMYRRSAKHQSAIFQWSCRLKLAVSNCF